MKYTKPQLVKAMDLYFKDSLINEDKYTYITEATLGEAKLTVEALLRFVE